MTARLVDTRTRTRTAARRPGPVPPRAPLAPRARAVRPGPGYCRAPPTIRAATRGGAGAGPVLPPACRLRGGQPPGGSDPCLRSQGCAARRRAFWWLVLSTAAGMRAHRVSWTPDPRARSAVPGRFARARDASTAGCELAARRMEDPTPPYPVLPPRTPTFSSLGTPPCLRRATGADARDNSCDTHGHAQRSRPQCAWSASIVVIPKDSANSDNSLATSTSFAAEITFSTYRTPFTISFICRVRFDIKGIHASNLKKISDIIRIATNL